MRALSQDCPLFAAWGNAGNSTKGVPGLNILSTVSTRFHFTKAVLFSLFRFPHLPDFSYQFRAGLESSFAWLPARRSGLTGLSHILESLELTDQLFGIASDRRSKNLHGLDDTVGVDDETATYVDPGGPVEYTVDFADTTLGIRQHGKRNPPLNHLGQFGFIPDLVRETAIRTDGQHLGVHFLEIIVFGCDRSQFRGSNKGEITWIEAQYNPLSFVVRELYLLEPALVVRSGLEIYSRLPHHNRHRINRNVR